MKRFTLLLAALSSFFSAHLGFSQAVSVVEAPLNSNSFSTNRGPNGTSAHAFVRGSYLVKQSELFNIASGTSITAVGFTLGPGANTTPVTGNFTVYLENTADVTYQKGTAFSTAIAPMTNVFSGVMTVPVVAVNGSVTVTLPSAFVYTGGGLYVAYDWACVGPYAASGATYLGETAALPLPGGGGAFAYSNIAAPATTTLTSARPSFLFSFNNVNTNDIQVIGVEAPGKVVASFNTAHQVRAYVRNASNQAQSNISVSLTVTGANPFTNTQTIPSLAAGAGSLVTFAAYNPVILGQNNITVSVPSDQNNLNNSFAYTQSITCNVWSQTPPLPTSYTVNTLGFATSSGIIATNYTPPVNTSLVGLRGAVGMSTLALNGQVCGVLLSSTGMILAYTNTLTITNVMQGTFQDFTFITPQSLTAGTSYYIGFAQITVGASMAGSYPAYYQSTNLYSYTGITAGAMTVLTINYGYLGIEAVFGDNNNSVTIASTPTAVCTGSCANLTSTGLTTYTWNTGISNTPINVCPAQTGTYGVMGTNTLGCPASASINIIVNPLPSIGIASSSASMCLGGSVSYTASGAGSYSWLGGPNTATNVVSPASNSTYTVTGTNANGCSNTATVDVSVVTLSVTVTSNTAVCKGKTAYLNVSGPGLVSFLWLPANLPFANYSPTPSVTTVYTVNASDGNNCMQSNTVMVTVNANPTVTAQASKSVICRGESSVLSADGADNYTWSSNLGNTASVTVSPTLVNTYNYIVTGTNAAGCTHTAAVSLVVNPCVGLSEPGAINSVQIFPNPNNGRFSIRLGQFPVQGAIKIYNTLGALVKTLELSGSETTVQADLSTEPAGIYLVNIPQSQGQPQVTKIIKQ